MKRVWKWIMQLNAKAFCVIAALLLCATGGWCVYQINTPLEPIKDGTGKLPDAPAPWTIGILDFVSDQLSGEEVSVPLTPFFWTMEAILADPLARKDLAAAIANMRNPPGGPGGGIAGRNPGGPGGGVRPGGGGQGGASTGAANTEPKMITPEIAFLGFLKDSEGKMAAMFSGSSDKSPVFYSLDREKDKAGNPLSKTVHGVEILGVTMKAPVEEQVTQSDGTVKTIIKTKAIARVRLPDGTAVDIVQGKNIKLDPQPEPAVPQA